MALEQKLITVEEMLVMPDDGMRWELIDGEIQRMPPPGAEHEETAGEVLARFREHVKARALGRVYGAPGVIVRRNPDRVRAPDFAFVSAGRLPEGKSPSGYLQEAPDLVGIEANRKNIERFTLYSQEQGLTRERLAPDDLFLPTD